MQLDPLAVPLDALVVLCQAAIPAILPVCLILRVGVADGATLDDFTESRNVRDTSVEVEVTTTVVAVSPGVRVCLSWCVHAVVEVRTTDVARVESCRDVGVLVLLGCSIGWRGCGGDEHDGDDADRCTNELVDHINLPN